MCGIFGIASSCLPANTTIKGALDAIKHRGPDDEGYVFFDAGNDFVEKSGDDTCADLKGRYSNISDDDAADYQIVLANRRLAIIDLSARGHQPMSYEQENLWITYNGEIFNYDEIRSELKAKGYRFRTGTDTEVVLAAYAEWGEPCINRFNGQWAFCIFDRRRKKLFCSRDRFGIKPFYYWFDGGYFAFASEMNALLGLPFVKTETNKSELFDFVFFNMLSHTEDSIYKGIKQLMPSHNLTVDLSRGSTGLSLDKYYELPYSTELGKYRHERALAYADDIRDLLIDAVRIRLVSDVTVGTCLSGGLDSSAITAIVDRLLKQGSSVTKSIGARQRTFTASFDDPAVDERVYADEVVRHTDVSPVYNFPCADVLWSELDAFLHFHNSLCHRPSIYARWDVMRSASKYVKVILLGQGGDELFTGYPQYEIIYLADLVRKRRFMYLSAFLAKRIRLYGLVHCFRQFLMGGYLGFTSGALQVSFFKARNKRKLQCLKHFLGDMEPGHRSFSRMADRPRSLNYQLYCDMTKDYLQHLLHYDDINASAFSMENRVPFLDHRLVEYVNSIPSVYKLHDGWSKWLLRLAVRDLLPVRIVWRKDKKGFPTPVENWLLHRDSPVPGFMDDHGIRRYDPEFVWRLYLAAKFLSAHHD
jgi:asparagine synthase (glutamine-hydrolysing)